MTTTAYEDAVADGVAEITTVQGDSWPLVIISAVGLIAFRYFRKFAR